MVTHVWTSLFSDRLLLLLLFAGGYGLTGWLLEPLKKSFVRAGLVRSNFRGQQIPVGMGSALWLGLFLISGLLFMFAQVVPVPLGMMQDMIGLLVVCTSLFVVGLLDDVVGNRETTGLRGHLRKWLREQELTTGLLKAVVGVGSGVVGAWLLGQSGWRLPLCALVIALSANSVNLLDVRPGRACKGVLLALACVAALSWHSLESPAFWLMLGVTLAYFPEDLKGCMMMGDAGSNLLGGGLGVLVVSTCSLAIVIGWLVCTTLFQLYAEKYSLSKTIEKNRLLRWLDILGRSA